MIGIILEPRAYEQDIRELLMAFYPGETFVHEPNAEVSFYVEGKLVRQDSSQSAYSLAIKENKNSLEKESESAASARTSKEKDLCFIEKEDLYPSLVWELEHLEEPFEVNWPDRLETKNQIKRRLYALLFKRSGRQLPWGSLTGIRPTKIAMTHLINGGTPAQIRTNMMETCFASEEKVDLSLEIAQRERQILSALDYEQGYSLYAGIPFCPTTCLYCSFTSYPIGSWRGRAHLYLEALFQEMSEVSKLMAGKKLDTIYIGGGTPTSLEAKDLDWLLDQMENLFPCKAALEFTVEAGRPDSITQEKLEVLRCHDITRISVNPQTMNQRTLDLIGRRHTVRQVEDCFQMARSMGFDNINMDLIVGLPQEGPEELKYTLEAVQALAPDSLTVHSLAVKRAARLNMQKEQFQNLTITNTPEMFRQTEACAREMGMEPYYLYRQKNMAGNFENVGYSKPGKACIYNILIMEEMQTIMGCGAGTTTKIVYPGEGRHERVENVKDVEQYITRLDEMLQRKFRCMSQAT